VAETGGANRPARCLRKFALGSGARARLVAIPHAGAAASFFAPWRRVLSDRVELLAAQLPGRETRISEPPVRDFTAVVDELAEVVGGLTDLPYVLFGHSMGALIAFELARRLRRMQLAPPRHLFVSSCPAPHLYDTREWVGVLDDDARLLELMGVPSQVASNPELAQLLVDIMRADAEICAAYVHVEEAPLECPITMCTGDEEMASWPDNLRAWSRYTTGDFGVIEMSGGHLYLADHVDELAAAVERALLDGAGGTGE